MYLNKVLNPCLARASHHLLDSSVAKSVFSVSSQSCLQTSLRPTMNSTDRNRVQLANIFLKLFSSKVFFQANRAVRGVRQRHLRIFHCQCTTERWTSWKRRTSFSFFILKKKIDSFTWVFVSSFLLWLH